MDDPEQALCKRILQWQNSDLVHLCVHVCVCVVCVFVVCVCYASLSTQTSLTGNSAPFLAKTFLNFSTVVCFCARAMINSAGRRREKQ